MEEKGVSPFPGPTFGQNNKSVNAMDRCTRLRIVQFSKEIDRARKCVKLREEIQILPHLIVSFFHVNLDFSFTFFKTQAFMARGLAPGWHIFLYAFVIR